MKKHSKESAWCTNQIQSETPILEACIEIFTGNMIEGVNASVHAEF